MPHDLHTQVLFELLDAGGKRGLRHVAALGCPTEMAFLIERNQISEILDDHNVFSSSCDFPVEPQIAVPQSSYDAGGTRS
jgi:hypothetical protein